MNLFSLIKRSRFNPKKIFIQLNSLAYVKSLIKSQQPLKLDIGCGSQKRKNMIGLDIHPFSDIQWDLNWGLPFPDNSIVEIRSDHCFEHLKLPLVVEVLSECKRVLVKGGVLDFTIPHINPYLDAYYKKDFEFLKEKISDIPSNQENLYNTCFDRIVWLLHRGGEHQSLFDEESIISKVKMAGFEQVYIRSFDLNRDVNQRFSSIYVVAIK